MRVKTCGITTTGDARLAADLGAWAVGLIFYAPSPRRCELETAVAIGALLKRRCEVAGVFVNAPLEQVAATAEQAGLTLLQLHGEEGPAYCSEAARRTGCRVIKATGVRDASSLAALAAFSTDYVLLDAHHEDLYGGTGETFDWDLIAAHRPAAPMILSGGLRAGNVAAGIAAVRPYAVDVASGVEAEPGRKDPALLRAFFEQANVAGRALEAEAEVGT